MVNMGNDGYLVSLDLSKARIVFIGGGEVAASKLTRLPDRIGEIVIVAPDISASMIKFLKRTGWNYELRSREYRVDDLDLCTLLFAATSDRDLNRRICEEARVKGILANDVSGSQNGTFTNVASIKRGGITIGVSSSPPVPGLSVAICRLIDNALPDELAQLLEVAARIRARAHSDGLSLDGVDWMKVFDPRIFELIRMGEISKAEESLAKCLL